MRHASVLTGILVLLALLVLASPVQASEWVEGDGFRFRLPDGFERISENLAGNVAPLEMTLGGGLLSGPDMEMEIQLFARDWGTTEQGVLGVVRMTLGGALGEKLEQQFNPQTMAQQMRQGIERAQYPMGTSGPEVSEVKTTTLGASHPAVELVMQAEDPALGDQIVRMAFANYESSIYIFMLSGPPARGAADDSLWRAFATTVKLQSVGGIGRLLKTYWPFLVGAAVLLLLVLLLRSRSSTPRRTVSFAGAATVAGVSPDGASFSRAMDGLPMYSEPGAAGDPPPDDGRFASSPAAASRPVLQRVPTSVAPPPLGVDAGASRERGPALSRPTLPRPDADLERPPASTAPAAPAAPVRPTNVARRTGGPGETAPDDGAGRFQRNQDFLGA